MNSRNIFITFIASLLIFSTLSHAYADDSRALSLLKEALHADQIGDVGKALTQMREAALVVQREEESDGFGSQFRIEVLRELLSLEKRAGNLQEALAIQQIVLKKARNSDLKGIELTSYRLAMEINLQFGNTEEAKSNLASMERIFSRMQSSRNWKFFGLNWQAQFLNARAEMTEAEGHYAEAESAYRQAFKLYDDYLGTGNADGSDVVDQLKQERNRQNPETMLAKLVHVLQRQGRLSEAELYARQLLNRAQTRQGEKSYSSGRAHRVLSSILSERGRYINAQQEALAAINDMKSVGVLPFSNNMIQAQQALAISLAGQEKWHEAAAVFQEARDALKPYPELAAKLQTGNPHWALTLIQVGQAEQAIAMLQKMLEKQLKLQPETAAQPALTRGLLGLAQQTVRQEDLAEESFRLSVPIMLESLQQLDTEDQGTSASELMIRKIVDSYIGLLMNRHQAKRSVPNGDPLDLAFRYADMSSASTVSRALSASAARSALNDMDTKLAERVREEQDLSQRISQFSQTLERLSGMQEPQLVQKNIDSLRKDIEQMRKDRTRLHSDIVKRFPSYANLTNPRTPGITDIANLLKPDEAFISIHPTDTKTYLWAIRSVQPASYAMVNLSRHDFDVAVDKLRKALEPGEVSIANTPAFDIKTAHQLYHQLFGTIEKTLVNTKQLILVTPGALGRLPLSLLVTDMPSIATTDSPELFAEYRQVPWLVRRYAITNLPAAVNFPTLRLNNTPIAKLAFAGFGDPLFSTKQTATGKNRGASPLRALKLVSSEPSVPNVERPGIVASEIAFLPQLPETRDEILAMANVLHADLSHDVFLEAAANEASVRHINLYDRRVIAFSTHGLVPGELSGLDSPALALSAPELASMRDPNDNGFLTIEEILPLKLNAEWVVLSACNTASGEGAGAEAFSGLGRAFFYAGARSILVSHWPVESQATEKLITAALRSYAENQSKGRAEALRQAELALIDSKPVESDNTKYSLAHPLFWAAFSLVGEGGIQK